MSKSIISLVFTVIFLAFLTAPTVITMVNDCADVSYFFSVSEEEKGSSVKVFINVDSFYHTDIAFTKKGSNQGYFAKKYTKPHLNIISPPPDLHLL